MTHNDRDRKRQIERERGREGGRHGEREGDKRQIEREGDMEQERWRARAVDDYVYCVSEAALTKA